MCGWPCSVYAPFSCDVCDLVHLSRRMKSGELHCGCGNGCCCGCCFYCAVWVSPKDAVKLIVLVGVSVVSVQPCERALEWHNGSMNIYECYSEFSNTCCCDCCF